MAKTLLLGFLLVGMAVCCDAWWPSPPQNSRSYWRDWADYMRDWTRSWSVDNWRNTRRDPWWGSNSDTWWGSHRDTWRGCNRQPRRWDIDTCWGDTWWNDRGGSWSWPWNWNSQWAKTNCTYSRNESSITCHAIGHNVTCETVAQRSPLPLGEYRIGARYWNARDRMYWYPLYPKASDNDYYDYSAKNPDNLMSHMALHCGKGEIMADAAVMNTTCFADLSRAIDLGTNTRFRVVHDIQYFRKCYACVWYQANLVVV